MLPRARLAVVTIALAAWTVAVIARLFQVQVLQYPAWEAEAARQQERTLEVQEPRGDIRTRDGRVLAGSLERVAVWANPRKLPRAAWPTVAQRLAPLVAQTPAAILSQLEGRDGFFYLAKDLEPDVAAEVARLRQKGVGTLPMERRVYPHRTLAAPVIGFVDAEGVGQAGLESSYEKTLAGAAAVYRLFRDGKTVPTPLDLRLERPGRPGLSLELSLDARVQAVVEHELERTLAEVGGAGAAGVVLDPRNGEILALASLPAYDPGRVGESPRTTWRNRAVEDALEPGSTFKTFIVAAALEAGVLQPWEIVDCSGGGVRIAGEFIHDHANYGLLPLRTVLAKSSNAGAIRIAHRVGPEQLDGAIRAFGFGRPTGIELPAEASGIYRGPASWSALSRAGLAIGQEVSSSALQLAQAYAAIANGGVLVKPTLVLATVDRDGNVVTPSRRPEQRQALSPAVAHALAEMLTAVVEDGTGKAAAVPGFRVAGKTGTAQKAVGGSYASGRHAAWFAGFLPVPDPEFVIVVCIDEPEATFWAADVAAPAFGRIAARLVTLAGLTPQLLGERT